MTAKSETDPAKSKSSKGECSSQSMECNGEGRKDTQSPAEIDYMHPDGKPTASDKASDQTLEETVQELKSTEKSLAEADGHHVCTDNCQSHHKVVAKGADKS